MEWQRPLAAAAARRVGASDVTQALKRYFPAINQRMQEVAATLYVVYSGVDKRCQTLKFSSAVRPIHSVLVGPPRHSVCKPVWRYPAPPSSFHYQLSVCFRANRSRCDAAMLTPSTAAAAAATTTTTTTVAVNCAAEMTQKAHKLETNNIRLTIYDTQPFESR